MAEKLQGLLDKIRTEGLDKANAQKEQIIKDAQNQADQILKDAQRRADAMIKTAEEATASLTKRAEHSVQQAARDVILQLDNELKRRLNVILRRDIAKAIDEEMMKKIIFAMVENFNRNNGKVESLDLIISPEDCAKFQNSLIKSLADSFKIECRIFPENEIGGGLKVSFNQDDVFYDFSDNALSEIIGAFVGPGLAGVINGAE